MMDLAGERVVIQGLKSAHEHNGKEGTVSELMPETGRFKVVLDSQETIAVKNDNLRLAPTARASLSLGDKEKIMLLKLTSSPEMIANLMKEMQAMEPPL